MTAGELIRVTKVEPGFRWRTMEGDIMTLPEMETKHIFNCMKMAFNHLAQVHGGKPVWFTQEYEDYYEKAKLEPVELARLVVFFMAEIERRQDLPEGLRVPYRAIVEQIFGDVFLSLPRSKPALTSSNVL